MTGSIQSVRDVRGFASLRGEWDALLGESDAGLFNAWEWLYPWHRRIGVDLAPRIVTVRDTDDALVGLLALGERTLRAGPRRLRRIGFLGETHVGSDYLGPVARRGAEARVARRLVEALRDGHREWDVLDFADLSSTDPFVDALKTAFTGDRFEVEVRDRHVCPYERFEEGEDFDAFLRRTARRDNYLRRLKWLEKQSGFQISCTQDVGELAEPLAEFFRLHAMRWADDGGSQGIRGSGVEAFHRDSVSLLAERGHVRLFTLRVEGKAVASVYGLRHLDRFLYFQAGYDPAWRDRSVGLVLVGETFRAAIAEGCREYDFLRGTEPYKSDWVSKARGTVSVRVYARGGKGAWLSREEAAGRAARELVKRVIPRRWTEAVRRLRRRRSAIRSS